MPHLSTAVVVAASRLSMDARPQVNAIDEDFGTYRLYEVVSAEETSVQVQAAFCEALEAEGLMQQVAARLDGTLDLAHDDPTRPILLAIRDPATLRAELAGVREHYNGVRLHAGIGQVTPNDEHDGRGEQIRKAREAGLEQARLRQIADHRAQQHPDPARPEHDPAEEPGDVG